MKMQQTPADPASPPLRYYGGKWRIAPWIISHFPKHTCYVEPFGGGGSVLLRKQPSTIEVYNDMDGAVVNFFKVIRDCPEDLAAKIELTPWSREELKSAVENEYNEDAVEWARRTYVKSWQGRGPAKGQSSPGWVYQKSSLGKYVIPLWNDISLLYSAAWRMKQVHIENNDALAVIRRYDTGDTLFYVDPPYLAETRCRQWRKAYNHEMTVADHEALAESLHGVTGSVVLSGYATDLYQSMYSGWKQVCHAAVDNGGNVRVEVLYLNARAANQRSQMDMFGEKR